MHTKLYSLLFFFIVMAHITCFAEKYQTRLIMLDQNKECIQFHVLTEHQQIKCSNNLFYASYRKGKIQSLQGNVGKNALHGLYEHFTKDRQLVKSGNYWLGLKQGEWKTWNSKGLLTKVSNWKNGLKNGWEYSYQNKKIVEKTPYKNGMINGKKMIYTKDSIQIETYKNNKLVKQNTIPLLKEEKKKSKEKKQNKTPKESMIPAEKQATKN